MTAGIGSNSADEALAIFDQFEKKLADWLKGLDAVQKAGPITEETAQRRRDFYANIKTFIRKADEARRAEKEPFMQKGREVDARWKAIIDQAGKVEAAINGMLLVFAKEQKRIADARAAAAAAEAEARRQEAAAAEAAAAASKKESDRIAGEQRAAEARAAAEAAEAAAEPADVRIQSATGSAKSMGLKTVRRAVLVEPLKAMMFFRDHPKMHELLTQLANAELRSGNDTIPGVRIDAEEKLSQ